MESGALFISTGSGLRPGWLWNKFDYSVQSKTTSATSSQAISASGPALLYSKVSGSSGPSLSPALTLKGSESHLLCRLPWDKAHGRVSTYEDRCGKVGPTSMYNKTGTTGTFTPLHSRCPQKLYVSRHAVNNILGILGA